MIPKDQYVLENDTAKFECFSLGNPRPDHAWYFEDDCSIIEEGEKYHIGDSGADFGALFIYNVEFLDHGTYTCVYNNTVDTLSLSAVLYVQGEVSHTIVFVECSRTENAFVE